MTKYILLLCSLLLIGLPTANAEDYNEVPNDIVITITGMTCSACTNTMEKKFSKENNVKKATADLETQTITVDMDGAAKISQERIQEIIDWGGYDLISIDYNQ